MGHREPGHQAAKDPAVYGAPALGGRDILQVRNSVQEAAAQWGLMEGQYERVSQSRELLYSVPAALCEEIARAALAERLSIPD